MLGSTTNTIHVIDFGLSARYLDSNGHHLPPGSSTELIGTSRYMSIKAHQCKVQSRSDDLEALGYVFVYFLKGKLPWSGLKVPNFNEHNQIICRMKMSCPLEDLCSGHSPEYLSYLQQVRQLDFYEEPNYEQMRKPFKRMFNVMGFKDDGEYDWNR